MYLTVLVLGLHELKRHELAPTLEIILGTALSSGAPSEYDWKTGVIMFSYPYKDFKLTWNNAVHSDMIFVGTWHEEA